MSIAPFDGNALEVLSALFPESSKNTLRSWLERGRVTVDGQVAKKASAPIKKGQNVILGHRKEILDRSIEVLYEDEHLVVIMKPEGVLSVATDFQTRGTAHDILKRRFHAGRVYPVHRLDRETSGVMVFAYTQKAKEYFETLFFEHTILRSYVALVEGIVEKPKGTYESFLKEDDHCVVHSTSENYGKHAVTHFEVLSKKGKYSLVRFVLETGRKNQIRVHCKEAGHPIAGDIKYCALTNPIKRLALHAEKLGFVHPTNKKDLLFQTPIPEEFIL